MDNAILLIVNDEAVTQLDVEAALFDQMNTDVAKLPSAEREQLAIQQLIEERLILQAAKQAKLTVDESLVERRLEEVRHRFPSEEALDQALMQEGLTRAMLRKRYRDQLMMQKTIEQDVRAKIVVTPHEVARYYKEHPQDMESSPRVRARHLLVRITPDRPEAEALSTVEGLRRRILKGEQFADVARAFSEGPEAAQGGDLGWTAPGHLRAELDEALFHMTPGVISEPIHSSVGYHLLLVEEREAQQHWAFEQVEQSIREKLLRQKFEQKLAQWLAELRAKAYIVVKQQPSTVIR